MHLAVIANIQHHGITSTFYQCCVRGLSFDCWLNCEMAIKGKVTIVETTYYFNKEIRPARAK